jgi:hypothetical protein
VRDLAHVLDERGDPGQQIHSGSVGAPENPRPDTMRPTFYRRLNARRRFAHASRIADFALSIMLLMPKKP